MPSALLATHPISQAEPGRTNIHNLFLAMVAQGSSPAIIAITMPAFLPVMLALSWVGVVRGGKAGWEHSG
jgi:hypothetical protein